MSVVGSYSTAHFVVGVGDVGDSEAEFDFAVL